MIIDETKFEKLDEKYGLPEVRKRVNNNEDALETYISFLEHARKQQVFQIVALIALLVATASLFFVILNTTVLVLSIIPFVWGLHAELCSRVEELHAIYWLEKTFDILQAEAMASMLKRLAKSTKGEDE